MEIASTLLDAYHGAIPDDVLDRAALQTFDAIACASGAADADLVKIVRQVTAGSGPAQASLLFSNTRASVLDAVLVNGTAVRYLDFNDAFIGAGPGGHPSDNIVVALAVGEQVGASGREVLAAIALGYEVFWRFRRQVYAKTEASAPWDGVSVSGVVAASMTGLLLGLDKERLAQAIAVGSATGYALKQLRRGSISMVKGSANALVAREGVLAAQLAALGLTGPEEIFEGKSGLMRAFGLEASDQLLADLSAPPEWAIRNISIKLAPAVATSQAAIHAAIELVKRGEFDSEQIEHVSVRLPDSKATREHLEIKQRQVPDSRESADHSLPFLIAAALEDGDLSLAQFEDERWLRPTTNALMERVKVVPDKDLVHPGQLCYPAIVQVTLRDGRQYEESVLATPGSPDAPWGVDDVSKKFAKIQRLGYEQAELDSISRLVSELPTAPDLSQLLAAVNCRTA